MKPVGKVFSILNQLCDLSATNRIDVMEKNLENDKYIFDEMALSGQITLFYAWPSTGKTLLFFYFIIRSIENGTINPADVFYINADDNYKGLYTKSRIAKDCGFQMISPAEAGIAPAEIINILVELAQTNEAAGKIIILDTLKKFTNMMNKQAQADLYNALRKLIAKNATVIIAGHANKHLDMDGNLVYEGTSDTMNDVDCVYSIYRMTEKDVTKQVVEFRREKDRGDVIPKVSYGYQKAPGMQYRDIVDSVHRLDDSEALRAEKQRNVQQLKVVYESVILFVKDLLGEYEELNQSQIIAAYQKKDNPLTQEFSLRELRNALSRLVDIEWEVARGEHNAKVYCLMGTKAARYAGATNG